MPLPGYISSVFRTAARGMEAQRRALGAASENLANANTSRGPNEGPPPAIKRAVQAVDEEGYDRFANLLEKSRMDGLRSSEGIHKKGSSLRRRIENADLGPVTEIEEIQQERLVHDPTHPHADENGYVHYPDVNVVEEMTRMISANRLYEANLSSVEAAKQMFKHTLQI